MRAFLPVAAIAVAVTTVAPLAQTVYARLPNDWVLVAPQGPMTGTDTMPQGAAPAPDGRTLAVVEAGYNPPTLRLYAIPSLTQTASIPLADASGRPVWIDATHVLVAGASADAVFVVDTARQTARTVALAKRSYPTAVASANGRIAVATDGDFSIRVGALDALAAATPVAIGGHIGGLVFSSDGATLFASNRSDRYIDAVNTQTLAKRRIDTGLHPSDLLLAGKTLYVAESDADTVGAYDASTGKKQASIFVGDVSNGAHLAGVSPNALARRNDSIFVSLGAANSVAILRGGRVAGRVPAGWYPTDVVPIGDRLYIVDGKGEGATANPYFNPKNPKSDYDYIGSIEYGSIRTYELSARLPEGGSQGAEGWSATHSDAVVRTGGPIRHVFFILKENRTYDQVLGDVPLGNGDPKLTWFGRRVTPNQHALAARFGLFDNSYTSGEVSVPGHDWTDAAFVTDYTERTWPAIYGNRGNGDETLPAANAVIPRNGYIWQAAQAAGVPFRDYGEMTNVPAIALRTLRGRYDRHYESWNLKYSDVDREKEWRREFNGFLRSGSVPALEYIWLPNDHTSGASPGMWTPTAFVAQNDYAVGLLVDAVSHSSIWKSSAIFIIEDDAQDGPDHVSDQRTTLYVVSPYARGGLRHEHYSTVSVLRTMELMLGIPPLSTYDAMAVPLYAAFSAMPKLQPYSAIAPLTSIDARNRRVAYGAQRSARMNFDRPDAVPASLLTDIIAHNLQSAPR